MIVFSFCHTLFKFISVNHPPKKEKYRFVPDVLFGDEIILSSYKQNVKVVQVVKVDNSFQHKFSVTNKSTFFDLRREVAKYNCIYSYTSPLFLLIPLFILIIE